AFRWCQKGFRWVSRKETKLKKAKRSDFFSLSALVPRLADLRGTGCPGREMASLLAMTESSGRQACLAVFGNQVDGARFGSLRDDSRGGAGAFQGKVLTCVSMTGCVAQEIASFLAMTENLEVHGLPRSAPGESPKLQTVLKSSIVNRQSLSVLLRKKDLIA
ncbi:MAG: hypothetical protein JWP27_2255, partial [Flaviaesturariibacter sp.]|nr:hypothetical protein [Flaviaesturariibacter sp.]